MIPLHRRSRKICIVLGILAALSVVVRGTRAWALGQSAPPMIVFAAAWIDLWAQDFNGKPQLMASVQVEIPGGSVPLNVQTVTVIVPGHGAFTMPFDRLDLAPERSYSINLTQAGVTDLTSVSGTYTFTVIDTAGGTSTKTDDLVLSSSGTPGIALPGPISITGLVQAPVNNGVVNLLDITATPTPTISWSSVDGAAGYHLLIRGAFDDQDLFFWPTSLTSIKLPAGIMVPGRRYHVRLEAFDSSSGLPDANARSRNEIDVLTSGPTIFLTFAPGRYFVGWKLDVTTRIYNTGPAVTVNALAWIGTPVGGVIPILTMNNLTIPNTTGNPNNNFYTGTIGFSHIFTASDPSGAYVVGLRLIDPATGETVALTTQTFFK